jgi:hypothetical protein
VAGRTHKNKRIFKPKKKYWACKKVWAQQEKDMGSRSGPKGVEAISEVEKPRVGAILTEREMGYTACPGSMVGIRSLDGIRRHLVVGSPSK